MFTKFLSKTSWLMLATIAYAIVVAPAARAGTVAPGFNANTFPANDDGASGLVTLPFTANYFGTNYTGLYVSNNGYITFNFPRAPTRPPASAAVMAASRSLPRSSPTSTRVVPAVV